MVKTKQGDKSLQAYSEAYYEDYLLHARSVRGLYDARLSVLARQMGLHVFASASDRQLALDGFEGNGLFTHTLLGVAAKGQVSGVNEWGLAARSDTTRIAARLKHAQTPLIISFGRDFPLLKP